MASAPVPANECPAVSRRGASDRRREQAITAPDVRAALARLSPEHRAVITEIYLNGHTAVETAEILGIPVGTVNSRSYYALHALREAAAGPSLDAPAARA
jgi:RNA polymerase sigma-70 factor (ECF subfamily)